MNVNIHKDYISKYSLFETLPQNPPLFLCTSLLLRETQSNTLFFFLSFCAFQDEVGGSILKIRLSILKLSLNVLLASKKQWTLSMTHLSLWFVWFYKNINSTVLKSLYVFSCKFVKWFVFIFMPFSNEFWVEQFNSQVKMEIRSRVTGLQLWHSTTKL